MWARARLIFGPRAAHVAPSALVSIKTPQGCSVEEIQSLEQVIVILFLRFVVVVLLLLVVGLAIRVKERECVKVVFGG